MRPPGSILSDCTARRAAPAAFLVFLLILNSCASSRIPLALWEKGAVGKYYASYALGLKGGAGTMLLTWGESWTGTLYGPMRVPLFSLNLSEAEWTVRYGGKTISFPPCPFMKSGFLERAMNGDFSEIPPFFECQGWEFTYDHVSGRLMGNHPDGRTFFIVWSSERPPAHLTVEIPLEDFSLELVLKDLWKPKPRP
jgi:hypothetical protein